MCINNLFTLAGLVSSFSQDGSAQVISAKLFGKAVDAGICENDGTAVVSDTGITFSNCEFAGVVFDGTMSIDGAGTTVTFDLTMDDLETDTELYMGGSISVSFDEVENTVTMTYDMAVRETVGAADPVDFTLSGPITLDIDDMSMDMNVQGTIEGYTYSFVGTLDLSDDLQHLDGSITITVDGVSVTCTFVNTSSSPTDEEIEQACGF